MTSTRSPRPRSRALLITFCALAFGASASLAARAPARRSLTMEDFDRLQVVDELQCSPDGEWVAYTLTGSDLETDSRRGAVWMVSWDGAQDMRLTYGPDSDSAPRWSPDGKYLSFLSARPAEGTPQIWLLDRRGGEARRLTNVKQEIDGYEWSPDGKRLVLVMRDGDDPKAPPKPIVMTRYQFKRDIEGYITAAADRHLYLFDIETGKLELLTNDTAHDDRDPAWSPDGARIAYISNHDREPDQSGTNDIFLIDARPGSTPVKLLTAYAPNDQHLEWSPDGRTIAYLLGAQPRYYAYGQDRLAVVPVAGGSPRVLTENFERMVSAPEFAADGASITVMVAEDRVQYPARVPVSGGAVERIVQGSIVVTAQCRGGGHTAMLASTDSSAPRSMPWRGRGCAS